MFLTKLKEDVIVLLVGLIIGIPALGILLPNLFAYISERSSGLNPSCVLRMFSLIYFTFPYCVIMFAFSFLPGHWPFERLKKLTLIFGLFMAVLSMLIICLHIYSTNHDNVKFILIAIVAIIATIFFCVYCLYRKNADYDSPTLVFDKTFNVLFSYIAIQWTISLLLTTFINIDTSLYYVIFFCFLFALPVVVLLIIYLPVLSMEAFRSIKGATPRDFGEWIKSGLIEKINIDYFKTRLFYFFALFAVPAGLIFIMFFSREKINHKNFKWTGEQAQYDAYVKSFVQLGSIKQTQQQVNKIAQFNELQYSKDSLKNLIQHSSRSAVNFDTLSEQQWNAFLIEADVKIFLNSFYTVGWTKIPYQSRSLLIDQYRDYLQKQYETSQNFAKTQLLELIHVIQKDGSMIFLSGILILVFLQSLIYFEEGPAQSDRFLPEEKNLAGLRRTFQIALLIIIVLLFPLMKTITEEDLKKTSLATIFQLPNWNLHPSFSESNSFSLAQDINIKITDTCCKSPGPAGQPRKDEDLGSVLQKIDNHFAELDSLIGKLQFPKVPVPLNPIRDTVTLKLQLTNNINAELSKLVVRLENIDRSVRDGQVPVKAVAERIRLMTDTISQLRITIKNINRKPE